MKKVSIYLNTQKALYVGLEQVKAGNYVGDIGHAIEEHAIKHKLGVVRELVGHGIVMRFMKTRYS